MTLGLWNSVVMIRAGSSRFSGKEVIVIGFKLAENTVLKNVKDCIFCTHEYKQVTQVRFKFQET